MRFLQSFLRSIYNEWSEYYIDYEVLRDLAEEDLDLPLTTNCIKRALSLLQKNVDTSGTKIDRRGNFEGTNVVGNKVTVAETKPPRELREGTNVVGNTGKDDSRNTSGPNVATTRVASSVPNSPVDDSSKNPTTDTRWTNAQEINKRNRTGSPLRSEKEKEKLAHHHGKSQYDGQSHLHGSRGPSKDTFQSGMDTHQTLDSTDTDEFRSGMVQVSGSRTFGLKINTKAKSVKIPDPETGKTIAIDLTKKSGSVKNTSVSGIAITVNQLCSPFSKGSIPNTSAPTEFVPGDRVITGDALGNKIPSAVSTAEAGSTAAGTHDGSGSSVLEFGNTRNESSSVSASSISGVMTRDDSSPIAGTNQRTAVPVVAAPSSSRFVVAAKEGTDGIIATTKNPMTGTSDKDTLNGRLVLFDTLWRSELAKADRHFQAKWSEFLAMLYSMTGSTQSVMRAIEDLTPEQSQSMMQWNHLLMLLYNFCDNNLSGLRKAVKKIDKNISAKIVSQAKKRNLLNQQLMIANEAEILGSTIPLIPPSLDSSESKMATPAKAKKVEMLGTALLPALYASHLGSTQHCLNAMVAKLTFDSDDPTLCAPLEPSGVASMRANGAPNRLLNWNAIEDNVAPRVNNFLEDNLRHMAINKSASDVSMLKLPYTDLAQQQAGIQNLLLGNLMMQNHHMMGGGVHGNIMHAILTQTSTGPPKKIPEFTLEESESHPIDGDPKQTDITQSKPSEGEVQLQVKDLHSEIRWLHETVSRTDPEVRDVLVCHRGFHREACSSRPIENSLPAYETAWAAGVMYCECDIVATKDGFVVLNHDTSMERVALGVDPKKAQQEGARKRLRLEEALKNLHKTPGGSETDELDDEEGAEDDDNVEEPGRRASEASRESSKGSVQGSVQNGSNEGENFGENQVHDSSEKPSLLEGIAEEKDEENDGSSGLASDNPPISFNKLKFDNTATIGFVENATPTCGVGTKSGDVARSQSGTCDNLSQSKKAQRRRIRNLHLQGEDFDTSDKEKIHRHIRDNKHKFKMAQATETSPTSSQHSASPGWTSADMERKSGSKTSPKNASKPTCKSTEREPSMRTSKNGALSSKELDVSYSTNVTHETVSSKDSCKFDDARKRDSTVDGGHGKDRRKDDKDGKSRTKMSTKRRCSPSVLRQPLEHMRFRDVASVVLKSGVRPPLLTEVLQAAALIAGERAKMVVELKYGDPRSKLPFVASPAYLTIVALIKLIRNNINLLRNIGCFMSFDNVAIGTFAKMFKKQIIERMDIHHYLERDNEGRYMERGFTRDYNYNAGFRQNATLGGIVGSRALSDGSRPVYPRDGGLTQTSLPRDASIASIPHDMSTGSMPGVTRDWSCPEIVNSRGELAKDAHYTDDDRFAGYNEHSDGEDYRQGDKRDGTSQSVTPPTNLTEKAVARHTQVTSPNSSGNNLVVTSAKFPSMSPSQSTPTRSAANSATQSRTPTSGRMDNLILNQASAVTIFQGDLPDGGLPLPDGLSGQDPSLSGRSITEQLPNLPSGQTTHVIQGMPPHSAGTLSITGTTDGQGSLGHRLSDRYLTAGGNLMLSHGTRWDSSKEDLMGREDSKNDLVKWNRQNASEVRGIFPDLMLLTNRPEEKSDDENADSDQKGDSTEKHISTKKSDADKNDATDRKDDNSDDKKTDGADLFFGTLFDISTYRCFEKDVLPLLKVEDGLYLDGLYIEWTETLTTRDAAKLQDISARCVIGVWKYANIGRDDYREAKRLANLGVKYINTDLPSTWYNAIDATPKGTPKGGTPRE